MSLSKTRPWNARVLIFSHILVAILLASLFLESTRFIWVPLDTFAFRFLNSWIKENVFFQTFWALANHRWADWVEDICFVLIFSWIILATPKEKRLQKSAECLFILLYSVFVILISNELLFRGLLHIERKSPTLVLDSYVFLPEKVTWLKVKAKSLKSFPGDHATTAILSMVGFYYLARNKLSIQITAICYGIFLFLPRLIVGAHWLTDIVLGSGSIVLISWVWAFCTPLASFCIKTLEKLFSKIKQTTTKVLQ